MTIQYLVTAACKKVGIPSPDASRLDDGLISLNHMLSSWCTQGLLVPYNTTEALTLVAGKASYTIGSGTGEFNTVRPLRIIDAYIRGNDGVDHPVDVTMTKQEYDDITQKTYEARPLRLYYDPQWILGIIYFNSEPLEVETLYLVSEKTLTDIGNIGWGLGGFGDPTDDIGFPEGYREALVYNLALRIADDVNVDITPQLAQLAVETKNSLENLNAQDKLIKLVKMDRAITYPMYRG